jgi:hypothetical protein
MKGIYFNNLKNPALDPIVDTMELNMLLDDPSEAEKAEIRDNFVNEVMSKGYNEDELKLFIFNNFHEFVKYSYEVPEVAKLWEERPMVPKLIKQLLTKYTPGFSFNKLDRIYINGVIYNHNVVHQNDEVPGMVTEILNDLGMTINKDVCEILDSIYYLPRQFYTMAVIARFSDVREEINIRRILFLLMITYEYNTTTVDDIRIILEALFYGEMTPLFIINMLDTHRSEQWYNYRYRAAEEDTTFALYRIVNAMPKHIIKDTLLKYSEVCVARQLKLDDVKWTLVNLPLDDYRELAIIADTLKNEGYYLP